MHEGWTLGMGWND